jgi:hypothetical protein
MVGSRRCASSKICPTTVEASWTTLAVSHLRLALGAGTVFSSVLASTCSAVRGAGVTS